MQFKCMFRNSWKYLVNTKRMKNDEKNIELKSITAFSSTSRSNPESKLSISNKLVSNSMFKFKLSL